MSSLDLLDYQTGVEQALAAPDAHGQPLLPAPLRSQALRETRRLVDAMAFRYALIDERPLPEDLDYIRALEGLKSPDKVARVLARRRPHYARTRRRRLVTTWTTLAIIMAVVVGFAYAATLEKAETLAQINERGAAGDAFERTFVVDGNVTRLHLDGTIVVSKDTDTGPIVVSLISPDNREHLGTDGRLGAEFTANSGIYLRENVYSPAPGTWTLRIVYGGAGSALVTVDAVTPNR